MNKKKEMLTFVDEVQRFYERYDIPSNATPVKNEHDLNEISRSFKPFYLKERTYTYSNSTTD